MWVERTARGRPALRPGFFGHLLASYRFDLHLQYIACRKMGGAIQHRFASRSDFLHHQLSAVPRFLDSASIRSEKFSRKIVTPSPRHQDLSRPVRQL
jgi:hypothetical protein